MDYLSMQLTLEYSSPFAKASEQAIADSPDTQAS